VTDLDAELHEADRLLARIEARATLQAEMDEETRLRRWEAAQAAEAVAIAKADHFAVMDALSKAER